MTESAEIGQPLANLLATRYSCRAFEDRRVPAATISRMFELAQLSASWCNTQPWQVTVVSGQATKDFAAVLTAAFGTGHTPDYDMPRGYSGVHDERRRTSGHGLYSSLGIARSDRAARTEQLKRNFMFFGAPHVAVITSVREQGVYGAVDCGGYVSTLLLAARSLGIDTVAQAAIAMYGQTVRHHLELPFERAVVCGVSFGFADKRHPANGFRTERAPLDQVLDLRE